MTITVHDLQHHLNIAHDDATQVDLLRDKIAAAVAFVEAFTGGPIGARATGSITITATPAAGAIVNVNGVVLTAVATGPASAGQFLIDSTRAGTASNLAAAIEASLNALPSSLPDWSPIVTAAGAVITLTSPEMDAAANTFTLAASSAAFTLSGPTLTGGVTPPPALCEAVLQLAAHLYANREATLVGVTAQELPLGAFDLLTPYRAWSF